MIFAFIQTDEEDSYCWVQAVSSTEKLLHCRVVDVVFPKQCGEFKRKADVREFYEAVNFLGSRSEDDKLVQEKSRITIPLPFPVEAEAFLFHEVGAPDVIRYMEGGNCKLCSNSRRPWMNKRAKKAWGVRKHGDYALCPLCIGVKEARETGDWGSPYDGTPSYTVKMRARVEEILRMRGY